MDDPYVFFAAGRPVVLAKAEDAADPRHRG